MGLTTKFYKSMCAGVATLAAGSAFAALPAMPLAEDYLVQNGVPKETAINLVQRLAGTRSVRVLNNDSINKTMTDLREKVNLARGSGNEAAADHAINAVMGLRSTLAKFQRNDETHAIPVAKMNWPFLQSLESDDAVEHVADCYIKTANPMTSSEILARMTGIPQQFIEQDIFPLRVLVILNFLHELGHCSPDNIPPYHEIDADRGALSAIPELQMIAEFHNTSDIAQKWAESRLLIGDFGHGTGLFLDADLHKVTPPLDLNDVANVYVKMKKLLEEKGIDLSFTMKSGRPRFLTIAKGLQTILDDNQSDLTSLDKRFISLYLDGIQQITPKALAEMMQVRKEKPANVAGLAPR